MKLSNEAYEKIINLLQNEYDAQNGDEDKQKEIINIMEEVEVIGTY